MTSPFTMILIYNLDIAGISGTALYKLGCVLPLTTTQLRRYRATHLTWGNRSISTGLASLRDRDMWTGFAPYHGFDPCLIL